MCSRSRGGDEGLVQGAIDFIGHTVSGLLGLIDRLVEFLAQLNIAVVRHQLRKCLRCFNHALGVLVEHFKKIAFARQ